MRWDAHAYFDVLSPEPGQRVRAAVLAAYSAEPVVLVAGLLTLAGLDEQDPSRAAQVEALLGLRGRVAVLLQNGRLHAPRKPSRALGLLDRYVRFVANDESELSWHPKLTMVWLERPTELRVWLGSRNLTSDRSWDLGLSLRGQLGEGGPAPAGLLDSLRRLASRGEQPLPELAGLRWVGPEGIDVRSVQLHAERQPRRLGLPPKPTELLVLSPFVDGAQLGHLPSAPKQRLVTTLETARELGPHRAGWEILTLSAPGPEAQAVDGDDEGGPESWALHAKAVAAVVDGSVHLELGSANLTTRGWSRNAEAQARAEMPLEWLRNINTLFDHHACRPDEEQLQPEEGDDEARRLERAINKLATVQFEQQTIPSGTRLVGDIWSKLEQEDRVCARSLGASVVSAWAPSSPSVDLLAPEPTELVELQVGRGDLVRSLVLRARLADGLEEDRDERLLARWLGLSGLFSWIRAILCEEEPGESGPSGSDSSSDGVGSVADALERYAPTLEEVLRSWQRDPELVRRADREVRRFVRLLGDALETDDERAALVDFQRHWRSIVRGLGISP